MLLVALKKSRAIQLGIVTKERNKYSDLTTSDPATLKITKMKESIKKVEAKHEELDKIQEHIYQHADDIDEDEEQKAVTLYEENVDATLDLIRELMDLHWVHTGISNLQRSLESLAGAKDEFPDRDHSALATRYSDTFEKIQAMLNDSSIDKEHPY